MVSPTGGGAMEVGESILAVGAGERPANFAQFSAAIDPQWIADALAASGGASVRRRKLPAEHVVWLVIGMGLFHDRSIAEVVHHLDLVRPRRGAGRARVSNAAIVQARDQLGAAPLAALFTQTATAWTADVAPRERWHGLAVYGLGGTTLRVPDTPANVTAFGRPPSPDGAGAGYPHVRLVTLLSLRHHLLPAAAVGAPHTGELALARGVWAALPDHAVVILDRGLCSYALLHCLREPTRDRHWLVRARDGRKAVRQQVVEHFGPGDALVELQPTSITCAKHPDLPPTLRVRAVRVQRRGFRPYWLFTSLRNPATAPATDLPALYQTPGEMEGFEMLVRRGVRPLGEVQQRARRFLQACQEACPIGGVHVRDPRERVGQIGIRRRLHVPHQP